MARSIFIPKAPTASDLAALDYFTPRDAIFFGTPDPVSVGRNNHPVLAFPDGDSSLFFPGVIGEDWGEAFLTVKLFWVAPAIAGDVVWFVSWERDNAIPTLPLANLDVDAFGGEKSVVSVAPPVTGQIREASIVFTQAEAAALRAGNPYRLKIRRDGGVLLDTLVGDAQLFRVSLEGTP